MAKRCSYCGGDREIEICSICEEELDNCTCEEVQPTRLVACPECDGEGETEEDDDA